MAGIDEHACSGCLHRIATHTNRISSTSRIPLVDLSLASSSMRFVYR
jgi:hypothetical protein